MGRARKEVKVAFENDPASWYKPVLKELQDIFDRTNQQFGLIKKIDRSTLALDRTLDVVLREICTDLREMANADYVEMLGVTDGGFIPMEISGSDCFGLLDTYSRELASLSELKKGEHLLLEPARGRGSDYCLCLPIFTQDKLFGVVILGQKGGMATSVLGGKGFWAFGTIVANELGLMIERYLERKQLVWCV